MGQPRTLFLLFSVFFKQNNTIFTTNQCEKCPSNIRRRDSNPRPLEHESSPITTKPVANLIKPLIYDSGVVPDLKLPHITTLEL